MIVGLIEDEQSSKNSRSQPPKYSIQIDQS